MDRRRFLYVGGVASLSLALAGCSGGDDETDDNETNSDNQSADDGEEETNQNEDTDDGEEETTQDEDTDGETNQDEEEVQRLLESADKNLDEAATLFEQQVNEAGSANPEAISPDPIREHLDQAQQNLDEARQLASGDQQEAVELLDSFLEVLRNFLDLLVAFRGVLEEYTLAEALLEQERFDEVGDALDRADANVDEARNIFQNVQTSIQDIDGERLDAVSRLELQQFEDSLTELDGTLIGLDLLTSAFREFVAGLVALENGNVSLDAGASNLDAGEFSEAATNFEDAADLYGEASSNLSAAATTLSDPDDRIPTEVLTEIQEFQCQSDLFASAGEQFQTAATAFAEGARLYDQGDQQGGDQKFTEGESAINEAEQLVDKRNTC